MDLELKKNGSQDTLKENVDISIAATTMEDCNVNTSTNTLNEEIQVSLHHINNDNEHNQGNDEDFNNEEEEEGKYPHFDITVNTNSNDDSHTIENEVDDFSSQDDNGGGQSKADKLIESDSQNNTKVITVTVNNDGVEKMLSVEILDAAFSKPFLGGFRHKINQTEYLNASCQTYPKNIITNRVTKFNRDTQTVIAKNENQQTKNDTSTQMTKPGCYISDVSDVVRIPGKYVTSDEVENLKLSKIIILQSYWRRWLATRYVDKLRWDRNLRKEWEHQQAEQKAVERAQRLQKEFERRMKPRSKADFDLLYAALERWRREETELINETHSGAERKAALIGLLEQEQYLIQSIERHRLQAGAENADKNVRSFLNKTAATKFWRAYDGKITEMNTQHTVRAQELRDLYESLQMTYLTHDERLDVLLTLKHTVKEYDCKVTRDLIELIEREADLLTRGIKEGNLEGLRRRINTLYLQFCKTPEFNPEVTKLLRIPQDSSKLRKDIYFCPSCNLYLPSTDFPLASNSRIVGRCKKCAEVDNNARLRNDFTKVRCIMQHLRRTEEQYNDASKIAFIIQDADLLYLIESIWNSQSALSGTDELYDLVFVRWNKLVQWSPWNCVLLTKDEASAHMKLDNVIEAYGRIFIGKVHHRHVLAKQYFSKLTNISGMKHSKAKNMMTPHVTSTETFTV